MRSSFWVSGCVVVLVLAAGWSALRVSRADARAHAAISTLAAVSRDAAELERLREAAGSSAGGVQSGSAGSNLLGKLHEVLNAAGLAPEALASLEPEGDTVAGRDGLRRQTARAAIDPLTLPQLGAVLDRWIAAQTGWTIASIQIAPSQSAREPEVGRRVPRPLRAVLVLESTSFRRSP